MFLDFKPFHYPQLKNIYFNFLKKIDTAENSGIISMNDNLYKYGFEYFFLIRRVT